MDFNFELIGSVALAALATQSKPFLLEQLQKVHDWNEDYYKASLYAVSGLFKGLKNKASGTKTILDDQAIQAVLDTLRDSAAANNFSL